MDVPLKKKTVYPQKYRKEWETQEEFKMWLRPVSNDPTKAFCKFCHAEVYARIGDIKKHKETKKHKEKSDLVNKNKQLEFLPASKDNTNSLKIEGTLALFIAEHTSIQQIDHLTEALKKCISDSKSVMDIKMHRSKCSAVIKNVLAPHFKQKLLDDIDSQKYSLLLDESTDLSVSKLLGVVIRYFSSTHKKVVSSFLALQPLKTADARGIVTALVNCLEEHSLPIKKLIGIGVDNASVMTGIHNSVHTILKTEYGLPNLILVRCVCHSLQLAVSHASEHTLPRNIEFLIRETYNWFSHSPKRYEQYKDIYETINCGEKPLKILRSCDTRWLSVEETVTRILSQWEELKLLFSLHKDKCFTADQLHSMYADEKNLLYMNFLRSILNDVQIGVKTFESENANHVALLNTLMTLLRSVCTRVLMPSAATTDNDYLTIKIEAHLNPVPYLGYLFETHAQKTSLTDDVIKAVRKRCIDFTVKLAKEIQQRLPSNYIILEKMCLLSVDNTLRQGKDNRIADLAKELGFNDEAIDKLLQQWHGVNFVQWTATRDVIDFWIEVRNYKNAAGINTFQELSDLALSAMSLPHSNAEVERAFSAMNIVKNKLRNKMAVNTLNSILFIRNQLKIMKKTCYSYELPSDVISAVGKNWKYSKIDPSQPSTSVEPSPCQDDEEIPNEVFNVDF
ncbi:zinc finger protein 862-like [Ostrinia furnacalis]|uniref:zinc finger protein 862-like n=1 Tax=Ostrinia furnacalis TaxID=93504 RepID=UPI00103EEF4C|nr:zinc finger protein 862-like [Ostrinia furnacalis]